MGKESFPMPTEKDVTYPEFEEGPNRDVPEIDQPKPEQDDQTPKPPAEQEPTASVQ